MAQPGAGPEAENCGQVQRVGPAGEGFLDDPVVAELSGGNGKVTGCPDHRLDIFPALITRPASASMFCNWEAFQMSR